LNARALPREFQFISPSTEAKSSISMFREMLQQAFGIENYVTQKIVSHGFPKMLQGNTPETSLAHPIKKYFYIPI
jgi:hypothetical protein